MRKQEYIFLLSMKGIFNVSVYEQFKTSEMKSTAFFKTFVLSVPQNLFCTSLLTDVID